MKKIIKSVDSLFGSFACMFDPSNAESVRAYDFMLGRSLVY